MSEFYLRTESIKKEDILKLSVISDSDKRILETLKANEPCLIEGSRGTGKSFLMKIAELQLEEEDNSNITVLVTFNKSSLIITDDALQFYHWMLAKTLKAFLTKLRKKGLIVSGLAANLLSNDYNEDDIKIENELKEIVKLFEDSYNNKSIIDINKLPAIEDVKEAIHTICEENKLNKVYFFFDEAAHVFRPEQQRQFFSLFKDLRSPYITCNAAIYPGVTYFGESFELTHDCKYTKLERNISESNYLENFKEIVMKQSDENLRVKIDRNIALFNTLALASGGNPRMLLKTLQDIKKFNNSEVDSIIKDFYRGRIWAEHTELGEKYHGHQGIVDWGRDFLENHVIPSIQSYNKSRKDKGIPQSTIYFWIHKDAPAVVKEALRLLTYTGIIRKIDSSVRATRRELGSRYEVKYGCIISLENNPHSESIDFYKNLAINKFPEFHKNIPAYKEFEGIALIDEDKNHKESLKNLLVKSIEVVPLLTRWQKDKLSEANINTIHELYLASEEELKNRIYGVGDIRARQIKNAVDAEIFEYISG